MAKLTRLHGQSLASQGLTLPPVRTGYLPQPMPGRGPSGSRIPVRRSLGEGGTHHGQRPTFIDHAPRTRSLGDVTFPYQLPVQQGPRQVDPGFYNYFEALNPSLDRSQIPLFVFALRSVLQTFNRVQLAFLARYLYDNDGLVSYAVDTIADYSAPITPLPNTADAAANEAYWAYWESWCNRADFSGRFHNDILQRLVSKAFDTDGDILPVMVTDRGFPQVQLLETWRIDSRAVTTLNPSTLHVDGVRIDKNGSVLGYFTVNALNNFVVGLTPPQFIDSNHATLLYDPDRYSAYRGMSPLRRGMNDIRDCRDIKGFEKLATKINAALAAVLEGGSFEEADIWGNDTGDPGDPNQAYPNGPMAGNLPPQPPLVPTQQEQKLSIAELLGGDIITLQNGKKLKQLDNNRPGERIMPLMQFLASYMVYGLGMPASFILPAGHTGPGERSQNGKAQRKFDNRQGQLARFAAWEWLRVIGHGIENDGLPAVPGWDTPEWQGPAKVSIDDGRDAQQWRADVQSGLKSRREHYSNRNLNWQRETDQGFVEDEYILSKADKLSKKTGVAIEIILARWGYTQAKPQPPQPPANENLDSPPNGRADDE